MIVACTITSIPNPTNPTSGKTLQYTLSDPTLKIDFSNIVYTQVPPCEWPVTTTYAFTIPAAGTTVMSQNSANPQQLDVITLNVAKVGSYAITLTRTANYLSTGPFTSTFSFTVSVVDPCVSTVITTFTIPDLAVINGNTAFVSFNEATDSIQTQYNIPTLCGPRSYTLRENNAVNVSSWLVLAPGSTAGTYKVTATPTLDSQV